MENQTVTVMNEIETINKAKGSNENDVAIVKEIVEGTVKKAETAAEIAETEKEKAIEVAKIESESKEKITELEYNRMSEIAKLQEETKKQLAEWEHEAHIKLLGINERIDARKVELNAKVKIVEKITDAVTWIAGAGALTAIMIVSTGATKEIQLEKIRQGHID